MKSIVTLFAIAALSVVTTMRAQDETESASPSPSAAPQIEDKAAPLVEAPSTLRNSSPSPSPSATAAAKSKTEETTSEKSTAKKDAAAGSAPTTAKKKTASTEKSEETSSSKMLSGPDKGSPESNVKRLENEWEAAVMNKDASFVQARVSEDFIGVSSKGKRLNKSGLIKEFKSDSDVYSSAKNSGLTVRAHGGNVVVANGTAKEIGKTKDGRAFNRSYIWTDTWVMNGGQWLCVSSQVMLAPSR